MSADHLYLFNLFIGIIGLSIGSFLNVVIYRLPRGESIVAPGSHCPVCGHYLKARELIPVFSFLIQKGKCRVCQMPISWRYPLVELLTGILFYLAAVLSWEMGIHPFRLLLNLIFIGTLLALAFMDMDTLRLPNVLTLPLLGIGLMGAFFIPGNPSGWESLFSALGAGGAFWLLALACPRGIGLGDVKLIAAMGAFLGFPSIILALFIASFVGAAVGIFFILTGRKKFQQRIPFGPYLALGAIVALFWGTRIFNYYWTWVR